MSDPAALLDKLRQEGRRIYADPKDAGTLRVSGEVDAALKAELLACKPAILALLAAEALHEEIARTGDPFADPSSEPVRLEGYWRMPDGTLMADGTREAFLWMRDLIRALRLASAKPAAKRAAKRLKERTRTRPADLDWGGGTDS